ncbi:putative ABC transport system substrate-binding protein [Desulfocicer vacuolatum DSM 3385]|uniref:Putative ABC transport system substrate-binding protein n=1 Tax=Desulfocicer vacuolatum DSM 3385 TaxID=1121400 RepID=A0A1W2ERR9_9BACT|nr:ABC transporter substrate-binding protein [Desulfocicer vacuolatum]SMD12365.1 putative ABC transport system substrate-binding protein [Desulfocicer vacuolatum DSM 3385]
MKLFGWSTFLKLCGGVASFLKVQLIKKRGFISMAVCCFIFFFDTLCVARMSPYDIAMITWRSETPAELGFKNRLEKSPYPIRYHIFNADQDVNKLGNIITTVLQTPPDIIYVFGTTATRQVMARTTDIPIVFNVVTRPVKAGIIENWKHSGNNTTGVSSLVPLNSQLKALKKVVDYKALSVLYNPLEPNSRIQIEQLHRLSGQMNFELKVYPITGAGDVDNAVSSMGNQAHAVYLPSDSKISSLGKKIMQQVNQFNIPSFAAVESMVLDDGALMGLVPNYYDLGTLAALKAIRILNGEKPGNIPCSTLNYFRILINMKTAEKIGVQVPTSLLIISDIIVR